MMWFAHPTSGEPPGPPGAPSLPGGMILCAKTDEWNLEVTDSNDWTVEGPTFRNPWRRLDGTN